MPYRCCASPVCCIVASLIMIHFLRDCQILWACECRQSPSLATCGYHRVRQQYSYGHSLPNLLGFVAISPRDHKVVSRAPTQYVKVSTVGRSLMLPENSGSAVVALLLMNIPVHAVLQIPECQATRSSPVAQTLLQVYTHHRTAAQQPMALSTCDKTWLELHKLRGIPPLTGGQDIHYKDYAAFLACNEVRCTLVRCSELPRKEFISVFTNLVAGPRMEELFDIFKASRGHPALQFACLISLHGVAELPDRRKALLTRPDFVRELLFVMSSPRRRLITPASADAAASEVVNTAAGAITTITGLFSSNGTLEPDYASLWVRLGAIPALSACLDSQAQFDRASPVSTDLPLCFFLISTSLLAGAASSVSDDDKVMLGTAWLRLLVDARRWIAHEAGGIFTDFFVRPNWLGGIVLRIPQGVRALAVEAAWECEREGGSWKRGAADKLACALRCVNVSIRDADGVERNQCAGPGCLRVNGGSGGGRSDGGGDGGGGKELEGGGDVVGGGGSGCGKRFKRCSRCHALYCSRECQVAHWKSGHRKACDPAKA